MAKQCLPTVRRWHEVVVIRGLGGKDVLVFRVGCASVEFNDIIIVIYRSANGGNFFGKCASFCADFVENKCPFQRYDRVTCCVAANVPPVRVDGSRASWNGGFMGL